MTAPPSPVDPAAVTAAVGAVPDPEMPAVTLAMLGVVHAVQVDGDHVDVELLPTFAGCPATDMMAEDVRAATEAVPGVATAAVRFRYDPPWTPDRITAAGRRALRSVGIAPPTGDTRHLPVVAATAAVGASGGPAEPAPAAPRPCPYCGSDATERDGHFGPTPCRDLRFCRACQQPFEAVRS